MRSSLIANILEDGTTSQRQVEVEDGGTYEDLLTLLEINPETAVVLREGIPVPSDDLVESGEIVVVRAVSTG